MSANPPSVARFRPETPTSERDAPKGVAGAHRRSRDLTHPPFTFGVALAPRANAGDWELAQALLRTTLRSMAAQTQADHRVLVAGHERPEGLDDPRVEFVRAPWPVQPPGPHNDDGGRKKHLLNDLVLARGGGLLMLVDADDWVERGTVAAARAELGADAPADLVGLLAPAALAVDLKTLRACRLPRAGVFGEPHRVCGSTTVARLRPGEADPVRRDPFTHLRSHHAWRERAAELGVGLGSLPAPPAYLVGTSVNHSALHGPHSDWFAGFTRAADRAGDPLTEATLSAYGLDLQAVRDLSARACALSPAPP